MPSLKDIPGDIDLRVINIVGVIRKRVKDYRIKAIQEVGMAYGN